MGDRKNSLCGDEGFIREDCTYIDVFLEVLTKGISQVPENKKFSVDLIIEPDDINFEYADGSLKVSYGSQTAVINDLNQLNQVETLSCPY